MFNVFAFTFLYCFLNPIWKSKRHEETPLITREELISLHGEEFVLQNEDERDEASVDELSSIDGSASLDISLSSEVGSSDEETSNEYVLESFNGRENYDEGGNLTENAILFGLLHEFNNMVVDWNSEINYEPGDIEYDFIHLISVLFRRSGLDFNTWPILFGCVSIYSIHVPETMPNLSSSWNTTRSDASPLDVELIKQFSQKQILHQLYVELRNILRAERNTHRTNGEPFPIVLWSQTVDFIFTSIWKLSPNVSSFVTTRLIDLL